MVVVGAELRVDALPCAARLRPPLRASRPSRCAVAVASL